MSLGRLVDTEYVDTISSTMMALTTSIPPMSIRPNISRIVLATVMAILATNAFAWGKEGHQVVAKLAETQLDAKARTEVDRLLALETGATLSSVSTWPDEQRNRATSHWHYLNFPRDSCTYQAGRECPDGNCLVGVIDKQLEVLASSAPDDARLIALKNVVHFTADVHQPLHVGYLDDRGGNSYQLQAFNKGSNLHALWDSGLIGNLKEDADTLTNRLLAKRNAPIAPDLNMAHAAEESCRIVGTTGFYPQRTVGPDYVAQYTLVLEQQLVVAGARLAGMLNRLFQ